MPEQIKRETQKGSETTKVSEPFVVIPKHEVAEGASAADTEAILDDIDTLLDEMFEFETADSFVASYIQRGGE